MLFKVPFNSLIAQMNCTEKILPARVNRRIGQAMHHYQMLADGDRVLLGVSGGLDSLVLTWLLYFWREKAPIRYEIEPVHIEMGFEDEAGIPELSGEKIREQLKKVTGKLKVEPANFVPKKKGNCFACAKNRRKQLFDLAKTFDCNKIAFGHHKDDLIETLFLNMVYSGNISTMVPRQDLFDNRLALIRPLAYVEKNEVIEIAERLGFKAVKNLCPLAGDTKRDRMRILLDDLYRQEPSAKASLFAAMANVREGYLL